MNIHGKVLFGQLITKEDLKPLTYKKRLKIKNKKKFMMFYFEQLNKVRKSLFFFFFRWEGLQHLD